MTLVETTDRDAPVPVPATTNDADEPAGRERKGSLLPVIRVIPPEAYENPTWKGLAYFGRDLAAYALLVTGLVRFDHSLIVVGLWTLSALVIASLFIVGHDAAHEALFKTRRLNSWVGHLAMLPSWHVFEGWVLGHNRIHHAYTAREGFDFVWHPYTAEQYVSMSKPKRLRHRFEWSWLGAGAYYTREVWWSKMIVGRPPARWAKAIRRDRFIILGYVVATSVILGAVGFAHYGSIIGAAWMIVKVSVIPFLAFQYAIGSIVHVHHIQPDIRWWPRREWNKFRGQMEGTTVMKVTPGLNFFFHWIMIHVPHHVDMRIPMYGLEKAADAIKAEFPEIVHEDRLRFRDYMSNTRACKLYDFQAGHWLSYNEALAAPVEPTLEVASR